MTYDCRLKVTAPIVFSVFSASLCLSSLTHVQAIPPENTSIKLACNDFKKKSDGSRAATQKSTIAVGRAKINVDSGDLGQRHLYFGGANVTTLLELKC